MTFTAVGHLALRTVAVVAISLAIFIANGTAPVCAQDYATIIAQTDRAEADPARDRQQHIAETRFLADEADVVRLPSIDVVGLERGHRVIKRGHARHDSVRQPQRWLDIVGHE